jgi:hypothetical protein
MIGLLLLCPTSNPFYFPPQNVTFLLFERRQYFVQCDCVQLADTDGGDALFLSDVPQHDAVYLMTQQDLSVPFRERLKRPEERVEEFRLTHLL